MPKIKVLGPNIDPRFSDCLSEAKLDEARGLVRLSYDRALAYFWDLAVAAASSSAAREKESRKTSSAVIASLGGGGVEARETWEGESSRRNSEDALAVGTEEEGGGRDMRR